MTGLSLNHRFNFYLQSGHIRKELNVVLTMKGDYILLRFSENSDYYFIVLSCVLVAVSNMEICFGEYLNMCLSENIKETVPNKLFCSEHAHSLVGLKVLLKKNPFYRKVTSASCWFDLFTTDIARCDRFSRMRSLTLVCSLVTVAVASARPHLPPLSSEMIHFINKANTTWTVSPSSSNERV